MRRITVFYKVTFAGDDSFIVITKSELISLLRRGASIILIERLLSADLNNSKYFLTDEEVKEYLNNVTIKESDNDKQVR